MKIGVDARDILRREVGITVFTKGILAGLAESEAPDEIFLYLDEPGGLGAAPQADSIFGFKTRYLPGSGAKWKQLQLPAALRRDSIDVFHSMTSTLPFYVPCRKVVTFCDLFQETHPEFVPSKTRRVMSRLYKNAARRADRIIAISQNTKDDLVKYYGVSPDKVSVVYPGLNDYCGRGVDSAAVEAVLAKHGIARPFILHVGALSEWRNTTRLVDAFKIVSASVPGLQLVLVGHPVWGYDMGAVLQERSLDDSVVLLDYVSNDDLAALYTAAEVLAMPSLAEGFGLPVIEAMSCGTPVVTSNISALPEAAGDAAVLIDPFRPADLAAAITSILTDSGLRESLIDKGYKQAARFNWRAAGEGTAAVYKSLA